MLELRSFQSLTVRINRNIAAHVVDTICKTRVGCVAIAASLGVAVEVSSSGNDAFLNAVEAIPIDEMAD
jgi:hypothetical protein